MYCVVFDVISVQTATPEAREKVRKVKMCNAKVQERIVNVQGALELLQVLTGREKREMGLLSIEKLYSPGIRNIHVCNSTSSFQAIGFHAVTLPTSTGDLENYLVFKGDDMT